jgi:hypothetical protein
MLFRARRYGCALPLRGLAGVCETGVTIRGVCEPDEAVRVCDAGGLAPAFFASPGGMQPALPGLQPQPVLLPWLHPGGVPPFCFQLALPWLKPAGVSLPAICL